VLSFFIFFALISAWSVSVPLYSGPDETSQVIHAAALVRGQLIGTPTSGYHNPSTIVTVPGTFGNGAQLMRCYTFPPGAPASCAAHVKLSDRPAAFSTYNGRYPPLYYAIDGLPTLVTDSTSAVFWMRLLGALMCSILLGLAVMSMAVWSRSPLLPAGFMCSLTPAVIYTGAVVNPNGLEIAAAICFWCSGLILALEHANNPPRGLVVVFAASGCVLTLTRPLSPLWTLLALSAVVILARPRTVWLHFKARRDVRWATAAILTSGVFAVIWVLAAHSLWVIPTGPHVSPNASDSQIVSQAFGQTWTWLHQMVGVMGWLVAPLPVWTYWTWGIATVALVLLSLRTGRIRTTTVLVALVLLTLLLPVFVELVNARTIDLPWQGRYTLPLAVGIVLLAAASAAVEGARTRHWIFASRVLMVLVAVGGVLGYLETLRRYAVGSNGPLLFLNGLWHPVEGNALAVLWYVVATALLVGMLWMLSERNWRHARGLPDRMTETEHCTPESDENHPVLSRDGLQQTHFTEPPHSPALTRLASIPSTSGRWS
jgi:hypothetical protein